MNKSQLRELVKEVEARSTNMHSDDHGPQHWRCVSSMGIRLAKDCGMKPLLPFLFGLFHDSMRVNDSTDPDHGARGADLAVKMYEEGFLPLGLIDLETLVEACETHTEAFTTENLMLGICYDSDRVNLWRVGIEPHRKFLSTTEHWSEDWIEFSEGVHDDPTTWDQVIDQLP